MLLMCGSQDTHNPPKEKEEEEKKRDKKRTERKRKGKFIIVVFRSSRKYGNAEIWKYLDPISTPKHIFGFGSIKFKSVSRLLFAIFPINTPIWSSWTVPLQISVLDIYVWKLLHTLFYITSWPVLISSWLMHSKNLTNDCFKLRQLPWRHLHDEVCIKI